MIGEINWRSFLGFSRIVDLHFVCVGERIGDRDGKIAWEIFFPILAQVAEAHGSGMGFPERLRLPYAAIEPDFSPMQGVRAIVGSEGVFLAVESEPAFRDAVGVAADGAAEMRVRAAIAL